MNQIARYLGLKYSADLRTLMLLFLAFFCVYFPQFYLLSSGYLIIFWIWLSSWLCTSVAVMTHNHQHCGTFRIRPLNILFDLLLSVTLGAPSCDIYLPHNQNHHVYNSNQLDWIGLHVAGKGYGWVRFIRYVIKASFLMKYRQFDQDAPKLPKAVFKLLWLERITLIFILAFLLWHNWAAVVLFLMIPNLIAYGRLMEYNHILHDGCDISTLETGSKTVIDRPMNWFLLNGGYHTAHHIDPGVHWSLLPQLHQKIQEKVPPSCLERSAIRFYFRFLFSKGGV